MHGGTLFTMQKLSNAIYATALVFECHRVADVKCLYTLKPSLSLIHIMPNPHPLHANIPYTPPRSTALQAKWNKTIRHGQLPRQPG